MGSGRQGGAQTGTKRWTCWPKPVRGTAEGGPGPLFAQPLEAFVEVRRSADSWKQRMFACGTN